MPVIITTNHQPREILSWIPESARKEHDYIDWEKVESGNESVSFVKYRGEYWNLNTTEGTFPHDNKWWYASQSYGFGILFNLVYIDGEYMVICGTYVISGE
jgi:hypothetical protein